MSQKVQSSAGGSANGGYDLELIYKEAVDQLQSMRDVDQLSSVDHDLITSTRNPGEVILTVEDALAKFSENQLNSSRISTSVMPLILLFERFGMAIDMVMQFHGSTQFLGVSIVGLVWGSIKFLIIVSPSNTCTDGIIARHITHTTQIARDVSDAFEAVFEVLDDIRNSLPALEIYAKLFGSSRYAVVERPSGRHLRADDPVWGSGGKAVQLLNVWYVTTMLLIIAS